MQFITPMPFQEAVDKLDSKLPIASQLNSEQWSALPLALQDAAYWSATIENVRFLQRSKNMLSDYLKGSVETLPNGLTALKSSGRAQFVRDMMEFAIAEGMGPLDPKMTGSIQDIRSEGRLQLIFDTQVRQAQDFGDWKQGQDPDVLNEFPAQRFVRHLAVKEPRQHHTIYEDQVALKTNLDFWMRINEDFGMPYGPWGWGCGHGVEDVDRDEAEALGLIQPGETIEPVEQEYGEKLSASTRNLDPTLVDWMKQNLGDKVIWEADRVRWRKSKPKKQPVIEATDRGTLTGILQSLNLHEGRKATAEDMGQLVAALKVGNPASQSAVIQSVKCGVAHLREESIREHAQDFLGFLSPRVVQSLPKLKITVEKMSSLGSYGGAGILKLSAALSDLELKRTLFHEMMHWVHRDGPVGYRKRIRKHFQMRTKGEIILQIQGYANGTRGKKDKWYEPYAGTVYPWEINEPDGVEVPTRYIEVLTRGMDYLARFWNKPTNQETLKIVLEGIF